MSEQRPLLEVEGLRVEFKTRNGIARVIDDLHLSVMPGETLGVVGESGCGKSMTRCPSWGWYPFRLDVLLPGRSCSTVRICCRLASHVCGRFGVTKSQ